MTHAASRAAQIFARFKRFHSANPQVWKLFEQFALQSIGRGRTRFSANAVYQRIRWYVDIETAGEPLKLNDHYHAYYARMFEAKHPEYSGFFHCRERISEKRAAYATDMVVYIAPPPDGESALMDELRNL